MTSQFLVRWGIAGAMALNGLAVGARADDPKVPETRPSPVTATEPAGGVAASRPASEIVLVRIGDRSKDAITQEEFNSYFYGGPAAAFDRAKDLFMRELVERKWFWLYLDDHPELGVEAVVQGQKEQAMKDQNLKTDEDFAAWLREHRRTPEIWRRQARLLIGQGKLGEIGAKKAADEEQLKKMFEADKEAYDGTTVAARHILIGSPVFETPEQKRAKREKAEKLREDLVSGKVKWEDAVKESADYSTRMKNGDLGTFARHDTIMDELAAAAFRQKPKEIGEVIETPFGYHILEVLSRTPGTRSFEESKAEIRKWLTHEGYVAAIHEARVKYPVVGVEPPLPPTRPPWLPATATRPSGPTHNQPTPRMMPRRPGATRPALAPPTAHPTQKSSSNGPVPPAPAGGTARPPG